MATVGRGAPQVVDVGGRDRRQPLILLVAVDAVLALEDMAQRRPRQPLVGGIGCRQQGDILGRVAPRKAMPTELRRLHHPLLSVAADQPRDLRPAAPADLGQIAPHDPLVFLRQLLVVPRPQGALDEAIDLLAVGAGEAEAAAGGHKLLHLLQCETLSMLHRDSHSPAVCPVPTASFSGSSCVGNIPPFRLILCWTTLSHSKTGLAMVQFST